ncbi:hypothetical protein CBS101457_004561 [Exobasidium rhododendri]|nr:hypothetical protein CBS101457_004561 [Exobasidium rhododendri]
MEAGGDAWLEMVVWTLKGVLHFEEKSASVENPFVGETESSRWWTVDAGLSDPECRRLARLIPVYVVPRYGRGAMAIHRIVSDEENPKEIELVTGILRLSDVLRDDDHHGGIVDRLWNWLMTRWHH